MSPAYQKRKPRRRPSSHSRDRSGRERRGSTSDPVVDGLNNLSKFIRGRRKSKDSGCESDEARRQSRSRSRTPRRHSRSHGRGGTDSPASSRTPASSVRTKGFLAQSIKSQAITDLPDPFHSSSSSTCAFSSSDDWSDVTSTDSDSVQLLTVDNVPKTYQEMMIHINFVKYEDAWLRLKSEDLAPYHRSLAMIKYDVKKAYDSEDDEGKKKTKKARKPDKRTVNVWRTKLFRLSAGALAEALHQLLDNHPGTYLKLSEEAFQKLRGRFESRNLPSLSLHPLLLRQRGTYATLNRMFKPDEYKSAGKYEPSIPTLLRSFSEAVKGRAYRNLPSKTKKAYFLELEEELTKYMRATLVLLQEMHITSQGKILKKDFQKARDGACNALYRVWERVRYTLIRQLQHSKEASGSTPSRRPSIR